MSNEKKAWTGYLIGLTAALWIAFTQTGCMQVIGAERINAWGFEIESTTGFEVSAGVQQFNGGNNQKTMKKVGVKDDGRY
jgi:hypothetical protein